MAYKVRQLKRYRGGMQVAMTLMNFVTVEHEESGIAVTKGHQHSIKAYEEAYNECKELVELWKRS